MPREMSADLPILPEQLHHLGREPVVYEPAAYALVIVLPPLWDIGLVPVCHETVYCSWLGAGLKCGSRRPQFMTL